MRSQASMLQPALQSSSGQLHDAGLGQPSALQSGQACPAPLTLLQTGQKLPSLCSCWQAAQRPPYASRLLRLPVVQLRCRSDVHASVRRCAPRPRTLAAAAA